MDSKQMMERCENAIRTGQTEHLFPVLARRTLELIEEDRLRNRREWASLNAYWAGRMATLHIHETGHRIAREITPAFRALTDVVDTVATAISDAFKPYGEALNGPRR